MTNFDLFPHISFKQNWTITNRISYLLGQSESIIKAISNTPLLPEYHEKLLHVSLNKGAQATTAIEGNTLTIAEIEKFQKGEEPSASKEYLKIEVQNILSTFNHIMKEVVIVNKSDSITTELIKDFHKMVGKDLNEHFSAIPGQFRSHNVVINKYKPPDYSDVDDLIKKLCQWLKEFFHYEKGQDFTHSVIQAVVTHVYIEWIHPFGDGNGRTGRLLEFYLMMREGNPDIASHILSNHYNDTRTEYYRQLENAGRSNDLTNFIVYALQGLKDGLENTLKIIQENQLKIGWRSLIYETFENIKYRDREVRKRKRRLILQLPVDKWLQISDISMFTPNIAKDYAILSNRALFRDLEELVELKLLTKREYTYKPNIEQLQHQTAQKRRSTS